ncbi:MAG: hypothetical protein ACJ8C6_20660, partial [Microvirga sp.]
SPFGLAGYSAFRKSLEGSFMRDAVSAMSQAAHGDKAKGTKERCRDQAAPNALSGSGSGH